MCRLLGWAGPRARTALDVLGPEGVESFAELGRLHPDGWGLAWWPGSPAAPTPARAPVAADPPPVAPSLAGGSAGPAALHATTGAATDPDFAKAMRSVASDAAIAHLRWATPGLPVVAENCHPFVRGQLAMGHNGSIYPIERRREILPPEWEARVQGSTDSERYLLSVVADIERTGAPVPDAVARVVAHCFAEWRPTSLNALFLTPTELIAVNAFDPEAILPDGQSAGGYYGLWARASDDGVAVASSGIEGAGTGWEPVDSMTMIVVPRATPGQDTAAAIERRPLDIAVPTGRWTNAQVGAAATHDLR